MRIGIASTDFEPEFTHLPLRELFAKIRGHGFASVQLSLSSITECGYVSDSIYDIPPVIPAGTGKKITDAAAEFGIAIAAYNGTFNISHPDCEVRSEGLRRFDALAALAAETDTEIITICSGTCCKSHMWTPHPDNGTDAAWETMLNSLRAMTKIAGTRGVTLAVETEASNIIDSPERARRMMDEVGSPHLKMILDAANLFHAGEAYRQNVPCILERAFKCFGEDIVIAHGKDISEGGGIDFCATGEGIVDFPRMLRMLDSCRFDGDMIVHGVYDEGKMNAAIDIIRKSMQLL